MRRSALLLLLALATTPAAVSHAQPLQADQADVHFREGNAAFKAKRYAEARVAYEAAFQLKRTHDIAANLGFAEVKLEQWRAAAAHLSFALRSWAPTGKAASRESAVEFLALAKEKITMLTVTAPSGAEILVDGKPVGTAPLDEVFLDPGPHTIGAKRDGFVPTQQSVQAEKGKTLAVTLSLTPVTPPPPTATASASAPPPIVPPRFRPPTGLIIGASAVAAAGLASGIGLSVAANKKASDAAALRLGSSGCATPPASQASQCATLHDAAAGKVTLSNAAVSTFIAGGAFAMVAAGLGIWAAVSPSNPPVRAVPSAGPDHVGLTLVGAW